MPTLSDVHWTGSVGRIRRGGVRLPKGASKFWIVKGDEKFLVDFIPYKGYAVVGLAPRHFAYVGTADFMYQWERASMKKKAPSSGGSGARHMAAMETALFAQHLPILEHLAITSYEDGDPRTTGYITLSTRGAAWHVAVKDPDSMMSFNLTSMAFDKLLDDLALILGCEEAPWEPDSWLQRNGKKKK